jgi:hypothetical protein
MLAHLGVCAWSAPAQHRWPPQAFVGLAILAIGELALILHFQPVYRYSTPWMWTGFILFVDGLNHRLTGNSLVLKRPRTLLLLLPLSIGFWVLFEAYNLKLDNWQYIHLPENPVQRYFGFGWAFATILPALFVAAELYFQLFFRENRPGIRLPLSQRWWTASILLGIQFLGLPLLLPDQIAPYLFGFVWLGVILVLDPINQRLGRRSLLADISQGRWQRIAALWWGGLLCGFLWEFWNYWAEAKWIYVFPILQQWKIFEMPVPGYLGFPFFAMECFVFCELVLGRRFRDFADLEP